MIERTIDAPPARCYDLARHVEAHEATMGDHDERAVSPGGDDAGASGGPEDGPAPTGLLSAGDEVTWRARHLGLPLSMTARMTATDRPRYFRDEMVAGPFASFVHDHHFHQVERHPTALPNGTDASSSPRRGSGERTRMRDTVRFRSPFGPLGRAVDRLVLEAYLRALLADRAATLATLAEGDGWRQFLE